MWIAIYQYLSSDLYFLITCSQGCLGVLCCNCSWNIDVAMTLPSTVYNTCLYTIFTWNWDYTSLERCSGQVTPVVGPGEDPGDAEETMSLSWPGNTSGSPRTSWAKWPGRGKLGLSCLGCCLCNLTQDKCWKMDGWTMEMWQNMYWQIIGRDVWCIYFIYCMYVYLLDLFMHG